MTAQDALDHSSPCPFQTTHWSAILAARDATEPAAKLAREELCRTYWYPVYAFFRKREGSQHDAEDLTQAFFADKFLDPRFLRNVEPQLTKFRAFLQTALTRYRISSWRTNAAKRRGGDAEFLPLCWQQLAAERFAATPANNLAPGELFDLQFALAILEAALARLKSEYDVTKEAEVLAHLWPYLTQELVKENCERIAAHLQKSEGAVKVALHRLRQRFREHFRRELSNTVSTHVELQQELRYLIVLISRNHN